MDAGDGEVCFVGDLMVGDLSKDLTDERVGECLSGDLSLCLLGEIEVLIGDFMGDSDTVNSERPETLLVGLLLKLFLVCLAPSRRAAAELSRLCFSIAYSLACSAM